MHEEINECKDAIQNFSKSNRSGKNELTDALEKTIEQKRSKSEL